MIINNLYSFSRYTVAKNGGEYWVGKESENVSVTQSSSTKKN